MLVIRGEQYDSWLQGNPDAFVDAVLHHIVETMPDEVRGIPVHLVRAMIEVAVERARKHGLTSDGQIMGFVGVMFEVAPNFDEEPTLRTILSDTRLKPAERWESLFADTASLRAAWEHAAHPDFYAHEAWTGPGTGIM